MCETKVCILDYAYNYINQTYNINNAPIISRENFKNKCFEIIKNRYNNRYHDGYKAEEEYKEYLELFIYYDKDELYRDYKKFNCILHNKISFEQYCYEECLNSPLHRYIYDISEEIEEEQKLYNSVSKRRRLIEYDYYEIGEDTYRFEKEYEIYNNVGVNNDISMEDEEYKEKKFFFSDEEDLNSSSDDEEDSSDDDEDLNNSFANMSI